MHPAQIYYTRESLNPSHYFDLLQSSANKFVMFGMAARLGSYLTRTAVHYNCDPEGCISIKEAFVKSCLDKRITALIDPSNPPVDWNETPEDSCKNEMTDFIACDIPDGIVCNMAVTGIEILDSSIKKINDLVGSIQSYCLSFNMLGVPARGIQFVYNRILHR